MNWTPLIGIALWALIPGFIARKKGRSFWAYYLLSFVITPLITTIITICLSKVKIEEARGSVSEEAPLSEAMPIDTPAKAEDGKRNDPVPQPYLSTYEFPRKIMYCRRCGTKLIDGSEFCSNCGTQIEKEGTQ